jgi:hypothetical protein
MRTGRWAHMKKQTVTFRNFATAPKKIKGRDYYAASSGNPLPTFRDNIAVPSSRIKKSLLD